MSKHLGVESVRAPYFSVEIVQIDDSAHLECPERCRSDRATCSYRCGIVGPGEGDDTFACSAVTLRLRNLSSSEFLGLDDFWFVADNGRLRDAKYTCDDVRPVGYVDGFHIPPHTWAEVLRIAPISAEDERIAKLVFELETHDRDSSVAETHQVTLYRSEEDRARDEAEALAGSETQAEADDQRVRDAEVQDGDWSRDASQATDGVPPWFSRYIDEAATKVHSRFSNVLTAGEKRRADNQIQTALYQLRRSIARLPEDQGRAASEELATIEEMAAEGYENEAASQAILPKELADMGPREFELYVAAVYEKLGYDAVHVGGSGDEGVDIILTKPGESIAVQCKHRSSGGKVGSADVQKLVGAVHNLRASYGVLATNGDFTVPAEDFADGNPVQLLDGAALQRLVREAESTEDSG